MAVAATGQAAEHRHHHRHHRHHPPMQRALASYYDLGGTTACGTSAQSGLAFASLFLPCATRVRMCAARCATAVMDDRGPYVSGRLFDLNVSLRNTLGCGDLCEVRWRRL